MVAGHSISHSICGNGKGAESAGKARIGRQFFFVKRKAGCLGPVAPWPRGPVALFLPFGSSMSFHVAMPLWQHVPNMCQHVGRHHAVPSVAIATN